MNNKRGEPGCVDGWMNDRQGEEGKRRARSQERCYGLIVLREKKWWGEVSGGGVLDLLPYRSNEERDTRDEEEVMTQGDQTA